MVTLNLGIDLGSDCLKIAYSYELSGEIYYGKLEKESFGVGVAMPAVAMYNAAENTWRFGDKVDIGDEHSFITVVKIKSLLSLLLWQDDANIRTANSDFYFNKNYFPKFYFPVRRKIKTDFDAMVKDNAVFTVSGKTPRDICQEFFNYAAEVTRERIDRLSKVRGVKFYKKIKITLVHPSQTGADYINELSFLVKTAFGEKPDKFLSSTKALSMYAYERNMIKPNDNILIFDMGEEDISVAKAMLMNGKKLSVDGADGHNDPLNIGGNNVDDAISEYIEYGIAKRETMGTPSYGNEGHIAERGLHSKQYLFVKDIKNAKRILSMPLKKDSVFKNGVPLAVCRDVYIQRNLSREEFLKCVGISGDDGTARKIADYILTELARPVNFDVTKIFVSGGLVETYGLLDYLKRKVKAEYRNIQIYTFDDYNDNADGFNILSYEDSLYAPAVGGAIVALKNYDVQTVVSLSYATWVSVSERKVLKIFLNKGEVLPNDKLYFFISFYIHKKGVKNDEIYSTIITQDDIQRERYSEKFLDDQYITSLNSDSVSNTKYLCLGKDSNSEYRKRLKKVIALKTVGGENGADIHMFFNEQRIALKNDEMIECGEGLIVDEEGNASTMLINMENLGISDSKPLKLSTLKEKQKEQKQKGLELLRIKRTATVENWDDFVTIRYIEDDSYDIIPKCLIKLKFIGMEKSIVIQAND